tara:strand:- start:80 stop:631 length:552 start_codon:yes stop_codon:yes gene_type:complete
MAQTIALQRGSTTVAGSGGSSATLFTQSGGTATRVIINGLAIKNTTTSNGNAAYLGVAQSGGSVFWGVAIKSLGSSLTIAGFDFYPGVSNMSGAQRASTQFTQTGALVVGNNNANIFPANDNPASYTVLSTDNATAIISSQSSFENCPQQFWIGSGDAVVMRVFANTGGTITIGYSFTTITES